MQNSIFRALILTAALAGTFALAVPRADACGGYAITEEDRVWSAAQSYLHDAQTFGGEDRLQAVDVINERLATARWADPKGKLVTHAVLIKLEGRWQVIGTRAVPQSSSPAVSSTGARSSSSSRLGAVVASKR